MSKIEIDLEFLKADKECTECDHVNNYVCFNHEEMQVRERYPDAKYKPLAWYYNKYHGVGLWYEEVDERE